jgi:hypothetical protein
MIKFFKNIVLFCFISLIIGEIVVRINHPISDIPQRFIDNKGIQKYYPNQKGFWKGGTHEWQINKLGWPGELPTSFDNLIVIIGDSFIENFMNPNQCHQSIYLKQHFNDYNFLEASRSGVSFIEAMEISRQIDSLKPIQTLIYLNDYDFYESIENIESLKDITQVNLEAEKIVYGKMKSSGLKKILYNWKLLYYFYDRFPIKPIEPKDKVETKTNVNTLRHQKYVFDLISYIEKNYNINNKILVFHPNSNKLIVDQCKIKGFKVIVLDSKDDDSWTFDYDKHWTCYGHMKVAKQISDQLLRYLNNTKL